MRNKYLLYIGIFLCMGIWACSNDAVYYDVNQKRSIYFTWDRYNSVTKTASDTVFFSFALYNETEYEYRVPIKVAGMPLGGVILYLKFKENDYFKPIANNYYRLSVVDGALPEPQWWAPNFLGVYARNNDRLYRKMLEYFWQLEELKPIFYKEKVEEYGLYLEYAKAGFYQVKGNIIWINYVFKPAYDFYTDPANTYEGFDMVNPDRFIR